MKEIYFLGINVTPRARYRRTISCMEAEIGRADKEILEAKEKVNSLTEDLEKLSGRILEEKEKYALALNDKKKAWERVEKLEMKLMKAEADLVESRNANNDLRMHLDNANNRIGELVAKEYQRAEAFKDEVADVLGDCLTYNPIQKLGSEGVSTIDLEDGGSNYVVARVEDTVVDIEPAPKRSIRRKR